MTYIIKSRIKLLNIHSQTWISFHSCDYIFVLRLKIIHASNHPHWNLLLKHGLIIIPAWRSNHMPDKVWGEITIQSTHFKGCTADVSEWLCKFNSYFIGINVLSVFRFRVFADLSFHQVETPKLLRLFMCWHQGTALSSERSDTKICRL